MHFEDLTLENYRGFRSYRFTGFRAVNQRRGDSEAGQVVEQKLARRAVNGFERDDMIPRFDTGKNRGGNGPHAAAETPGRFRAFQRGYFRFRNVGGRIADAGHCAESACFAELQLPDGSHVLAGP